MAIDPLPQREATVPFSSVERDKWAQSLRANCRLLGQSSPDTVSGLTLTRRLGDGATPARVRFLGEHLAAEYDLRFVLELEGEVASARLSRKDGAAPAADRRAPRRDDDPFGLADLPEGGFVAAGDTTVWAVTTAVALGSLALIVLAADLLQLSPFGP